MIDSGSSSSSNKSLYYDDQIDIKHREINIFKVNAKNPINSVDQAVLYCNTLIATGVLRFGNDMQSGVITFTILNVVCMVFSTFGIWLLLLTAKLTDSLSYEEIWSVTVSNTTKFIPNIILILICICAAIQYFYLIERNIEIIIGESLSFNSNNCYLNSFFYLGIIYIVVILPLSALNTCHLLVYPSYIAIFCILFLFIYIVYTFGGQMNYNNGVFDPSNKLEIVSQTNLGSCIQGLIFGYVFQPMIFPVLKSGKNHSLKSIMRLIVSLLAFALVLYELFGLFSYFTLFDMNHGDPYIYYFDHFDPNNPHFIGSRTYNIMSAVIAIVLLLTSIPVYIYPAAECMSRFINFSKFNNPERMKFFLTFIIRILLGIFCFTIAILSELSNSIAAIIADIGFVIIGFNLPPLFYIRITGTEHKKTFICAIIVFLISIFLVGFMIYYEVVSY